MQAEISQDQGYLYRALIILWQLHLFSFSSMIWLVDLVRAIINFKFTV